MPRIQFSDVTPPERRSIRDVPIPSGGRRKVPLTKSVEEASSVPPSSPNFESKMSEITEKKNEGAYEYYYPKEKRVPEPHRGPLGRSKKHWIWGSAVAVLIAVFIVGMMTVFSSATISITPKSQNLAVDMEITTSLKGEEGAVRHEIIKLAKEKTATVPAAGEETVELKASGKIVIYNNFSSEPQRLIVRTRFESPDGLIYRIPESVVVPGKSVKNGTETPGSIEIEVFADEPGEKYNIKKTDFTIPGFKNDPGRFKGFYARSATEMAGGFVGKRKTVLPADKQTALEQITAEAENELKKELESRIPEGLVLLGNSIVFESRDLPQEENSSGVLVKEEVTAYAAVFNSQDLSEKIVGKYLAESADWQGIKASIKDFSSLQIKDLPENIETGDKFDLQIAGEARAWAIIDTDLVSQKILGAPKKDVPKLMNEFPGISGITSILRPVWKQSLPKDSFRIKVEISLEN